MKRIIVKLDANQVDAIRPMVNQLVDMAEAKRPGMLLAQIQGSEMSVFVADHEQGKAVQAAFGRPVGKTTGSTRRRA